MITDRNQASTTITPRSWPAQALGTEAPAGYRTCFAKCYIVRPCALAPDRWHVFEVPIIEIPSLLAEAPLVPEDGKEVADPPAPLLRSFILDTRQIDRTASMLHRWAWAAWTCHRRYVAALAFGMATMPPPSSRRKSRGLPIPSLATASATS